jgi:acetyl esterase/lipase
MVSKNQKITFYTLVVIGLCLIAGSKLQAKKSTNARIRGDGTLVVNGKPVFVIGARAEKLAQIAEVADCGFNLIEGSGEWQKKHYDIAHKQGLFILAGHYVWATFAGTKKGVNIQAMDGTWGKSESGIDNLLKYGKDQSRRTIEEALKEFDHLPGVIGWKIAEEPRAFLSEIVGRGYEIFKSYNPRHIVSIQHDKWLWFPCFKYSCDVLELDVYALRGDKYPIRYAASILEIYSRIKKALEVFDSKAVWFVAQVQPPSYWKPFNSEEELTLRDYRAQIYSALTAGAKGVIYYHWNMLRKAKRKNKKERDGWEYIIVNDKVYRERINIIKKTVKEMHKLGPIIADGTPNNRLYIRWVNPGKNGPGLQLTRTIEYDGKQYLFVVNPLDVPVSAHVFGINYESVPKAYSGKVFLGKNDLSITMMKPGNLKISIAPMGAGVFAFTRRSIINKNTKFNPNKKFSEILNNSWPEQVKDISYKTSDDSPQHAMAYLPKTAKKIPLLVALHSWNGDYKQKFGAYYANLCVANNWAYIHPNFRGPNKRREALCSELAIKDIIDAVEYAKKHSNIDASRIYLTGFSGGGMAALMAMAKYPELWAAVSVWCPVTDLNSWYNYSKGKSWQRGIIRDLRKVFGGAPDKDEKTKAEYAKRSPVTYFARGISGLPKLDLNIGLKDRDVPVDQGIKVFNLLAKAKETITESELAELKTKKIPVSLAYKNKHSYRNYKGKVKKLVVRKNADNVRLNIFNGHHEFCPVDTFKWLSKQKKN